jgi:pimeloyl-ACP methyl ester carboxylesterase
MKKIVYLLALLFYVNSIVSQQVISQDSINQIELYTKYKTEFDQYEKKHGKYIQTNNVKMHYLTWGSSTGTPLIWSHGTYSNGYELLEIADDLVKMGFYVIAIDYYGHGFTPIPQKAVSIYHVADDIKFLMDKLKIKKAVIGGWSRGGSISTAFYDAYPEKVLGLILEDGGSVAWDINSHKGSIDAIKSETIDYYKNKKEPIFKSEMEAYWFLYNNWGIKGKTDLKLKKEIFTSIARIKKDASNTTWKINPGVEELTGENNSEQDLANIFQPLAAKSMFGSSTHMLNPKVIYRNLNVPMIIYDPISKDDWYDFKSENESLKNTKPDLITLIVYNGCWHGVKDEKTEEFKSDLKVFYKSKIVKKSSSKQKKSGT